MFVGTLYAPVDLWCASRLGNDAVVAVSFAAPLFFVLMAFSSGLSQATTALVAARLGAGEQGEARAVWRHALLLALLGGVLLTVLGAWGIPRMLVAQGASGEALLLSGDFSRVLFAGAAAFMLVATVNSALLVEGDARPNFWFLLSGCAANLVLNFVWMRTWGVSGLAASTVAVQFVGVIALFLVARRRGWGLGGPAAFRIAIFRALIRQALPTVLNMLMIPVAVFLVTRQVACFGPEAVAGYGFAARIEHLFSMPLIGLVTPILPLASRSRGAGDLVGSFLVWATGAGIAFIVAIFLSLLMLLSGPQLYTFSGLTGASLACMDRYLVFAAITLPAYPLLFSVVFYMQALGRPEYGMWIGLARHCLAPMFLLPIFAIWLGLSGVWAAIACIAWVAALVAFGLALFCRKNS